MLTALSIRDVVLIDRLDLTFENGLCALTGETGAGKSILLDALGLAIGARGDSGLVAADAERAVVTAAFDLAADHPVHAVLVEQGFDDPGRELVLRRILQSDGRGRAFVNDQPASVGLLRQLGETLIEIQGQFEPRGLIDPATHRALLDGYAGLDGEVRTVRDAHRVWREATADREDAERVASAAERDREFLEHAVAELVQLAPQADEEGHLAERRTLLMHAEQIVEAMNAASAELAGGRSIEDALQAAQKHLARVADKAGGALDGALQALERAALEAGEALRELAAAGDKIDLDRQGLEEIEERLFSLRAIARKHKVAVVDLPALCERLAAQLALVQDRGDAVARLKKTEADARARYEQLARALGAARRAAATQLDAAVNAELPPLRLDKARFVTSIDERPEEGWGPEGMHRVSFLVSTNPGTPEGPLSKIASGGELSRIMLALKVVAAEPGAVPTLVFDEVDANIGGATAHAVGERLARLAETLQVLVITHSPQVAARATDHLHVEKETVPGGEAAVTRVTRLDQAKRREEIARMLSGAAVTDEARAAATRLLEGVDA